MNNLKQIRKELGLTQKQLAQELGLAKNGDVYIRRVENGRAEPSGLLLKAIQMLYESKFKYFHIDGSGKISRTRFPPDDASLGKIVFIDILGYGEILVFNGADWILKPLCFDEII